MLVENSVVVANFIRGIYTPLAILSAIDSMVFVICTIVMSAYLLDDDKVPAGVKWTMIVSAPFLLFCLWFFCTFTLK